MNTTQRQPDIYEKLYQAKLAAMDGAIVEAIGFTMLKGVEYGKFRLRHVAHKIHGDVIEFYRPRGKKKLAVHFAGSVMGAIECVRRGDCNGLEILS